MAQTQAYRPSRVRLAVIADYAHDVPTPTKGITGPEDLFGMVQPILAHEPHQVYIALALDARNHVISYTEIGRGELLSCYVSNAAIAKYALLSNAASVILAHNHPSGDPVASPQDRDVHERVANALALFDVKVLDSLVIGRNAFGSASRGWSVTEVP